jgi:hypothetical protein
MRACLAELNIPPEGLYTAMPPALCSVLGQSQLQVAAVTGDDKSPIRSGSYGEISQMEILASNSLPTYMDTVNGAPQLCFYIPFGIPYAVSFATQMVKTETLRNLNTFGDILRGLQVYGRKTIKPEALGFLYGYIPAGAFA